MADEVTQCRAQAATYLALAAVARNEQMRLRYIDRAESWRQLADDIVAARRTAPVAQGTVKP